MWPVEKRTTGILLLGIAVCLGLTTFVYWPGLAGPFMLDDAPNIENGFIQNPDWDAIVYTVTHNGSGMLGRSVAMLTFVLSGLQYGLDPWGFKFHNLLLHLLNGVLLFRLLQVVLPRLDARLATHKVLLIAATTSALWLLHPLLVSTVLYVVQRMAMLSTLFTLLALLAYAHARAHTGSRRFWIFGWLVMPLMTVLSVLSKESGALMPVYLLVMELCVFRTRLSELRQNRRLAIFVATFIIVPLITGIALVLVNFTDFTDYSMRSFTLKERLLTQVHAIFFYVRLILLPRIGSMSLFHDDFLVTTQFDALTIFMLFALMGVISLAWRVRNSHGVVAFGALMFFAAHLLESTLFPLELVFEHRNYFASAGLLLLPAYVLFKVENYRALFLLPPVFILTFAFMTATRAKEWGDRDVFHRVSVVEHPGSARALNNFVNYLMSNGRLGDAIVNLEKLIALTPEEVGPYLHLQVAKCGTGERDANALARAREIAARFPMPVYGHSALQALIVNVVEGRCDGLTVDDVEPIVDAAFAYAEQNQALDYFDNLYRIRAIIAMNRGRYAQGYSDFRIAHEITGKLEVLHELIQYQVRFARLQDAAEILQLMEQQNAQRFGIDTYVVKQARQLLADARDGEPTEGEAGTPAPLPSLQ